MATEKTTITHPYDVERHPVKKNMCFVIIPFSPKFDLVYDIIKESLDGIMECRRADDIGISFSIFENVFEGIASASFIIADLTGQNANVFYELGFAHTCTKNVLLLTQDIKDVPFDLMALNCVPYSTNSKNDLDKLSEIIKKKAAGVQDKYLPTLIENKLERTKKIVMYMEQLLKKDSNKLNDMIILHEAGLSSLSNTRYPIGHKLSNLGELLVEERNLLIKLLEKRAELHVSIYPFNPFISSESDKPRMEERLKELLNFLKSDKEEVKRCKFATADGPGPNLLFFGDDILFEGHRPGPREGFDWTIVYSDKNYINGRIKIFNNSFDKYCKKTIENYGSKGDDPNNPEHLRKAVIKAVEEAIEELDKETSTTRKIEYIGE